MEEETNEVVDSAEVNAVKKNMPDDILIYDLAVF